MKRAAVGLLLLSFGTGAGWLDRWQHARAGNRLYDQGKFEEASQAYNQGLVEDPDSTLLHFNLGASQYKQGQYDAALKALQQVPTTDADPARAGEVAYNAGNAAYKLGTMSEGSQPQKALEQWTQALVFYRRALGLRPDDADTKFNYEFVAKRIADLKQKLEEQKKQQDEKKKDEQQKDQQHQDQKKDQQDQQQDQAKDQQQEQPKDQPQDQPKDQDQQQAKDEQQPKDGQPKDDQQQPPPQDQAQQQPPSEQPKEDQQQAAGEPSEDKPDGAGTPSDSDIAGEKKDGEMSKKEATALLDGERGEEVQPDEVVKRLQGAKVGRPAKDW